MFSLKNISKGYFDILEFFSFRKFHLLQQWRAEVWGANGAPAPGIHVQGGIQRVKLKN